jgi:hypothetical protein
MSFSTHATTPVKSPFTSSIQQQNDIEDDLLRRLNGHHHKGQKVDLQPNGPGEFTFRSGTIYTGNFVEGMFDGAGTLTFPDGARFVATWSLGKLVDGTYYFADKLEYAPKNWQYCTDADRRFWSEQQFGIQFGEFPQLTDSGETNTKAIPYGTYDTGDAYLDPKDNKLYNYDVSVRQGRRSAIATRDRGALVVGFSVRCASYPRFYVVAFFLSPGHLLSSAHSGGAGLGQEKGATGTGQAQGGERGAGGCVEASKFRSHTTTRKFSNSEARWATAGPEFDLEPRAARCTCRDR